MIQQRTVRVEFMAWSIFAGLCMLATAGVLAETLRALWSAFMSGGGMGDGTMYTNMLWNSGHGSPFRFYVTNNYLGKHLSFTLVPIGFLFHVWDHPFLLYAVQWLLLLCGGLAILIAAAVRLKLPMPAIGAVSLFFAGYVLTQRVMLSAFHGSHTYYLLIPWLYYTLRFRKAWAILPLALLLGVREDAFLIALPILAHAAWRDRSKGAAALLGLAICYGIFALVWLFPHINGLSITEKRGEIPGIGNLFATWHDEGLTLRARALLLWAPPLLLFIRKKATAVWLYPSIPILISLFSEFWRQFGLFDHYAAPIVTTLAVGIVDSSASARAQLPANGRDTTSLRAVALVVVTIAAHIPLGIVRTGAHNAPRYRFVPPEARAQLAAASFLPKDGVLVTDVQLAPFCANRRDLLTWSQLDEEKLPFDIVFGRMRKIFGLRDGSILQGIRDGGYGVVYFDTQSFIVQRGGPTNKNAELLSAYDDRARILYAANSRQQAGDDVFEANEGFVRHWIGDRSRGPVNICHGKSVSLPPGRYAVTIRYRAEQPQRNVRNSWGTFAVFRPGESAPLVEAPIERVIEPGNAYRNQIIEFTNAEAGQIEFRIDAADAPLWVLSAKFESVD